MAQFPPGSHAAKSFKKELVLFSSPVIRTIQHPLFVRLEHVAIVEVPSTVSALDRQAPFRSDNIRMMMMRASERGRLRLDGRPSRGKKERKQRTKEHPRDSGGARVCPGSVMVTFSLWVEYGDPNPALARLNINAKVKILPQENKKWSPNLLLSRWRV